jgi:hypothetical protein
MLTSNYFSAKYCYYGYSNDVFKLSTSFEWKRDVFAVNLSLN